MKRTALLAALVLLHPHLAPLDAGDLDIREGWTAGRYGTSTQPAYRVNPLGEGASLRYSRRFLEELRPTTSKTLSYDALRQLGTPREWQHGTSTYAAEPLPRNPRRRGVWYHWTLAGVPENAEVERAVLRVYPRASSQRLARELELPPRVYLSFAPWGAELERWTGDEPPPEETGARPFYNGPVWEWDVTGKLADVRSRPGRYKDFALVVRNSNHARGPGPVLAVHYRLPIAAGD